MFNKLLSLSPITRQSMIQLGFTIIVSLLGFISTMFFSRVLGADVLGSYFMFLTYFSIFNLIGDGGFGGALIKKVSEGKEQNEYFSAYFVIRTCLVIVSSLLLLGFFENPIILICALIVAYLSNVITAGVCAKNHIGIYNASFGISELIRIVVSVLLVIFGYSLYGMIGGWFIGIIVVGILCFKYFNYKIVKFNKNHVKNLLSFGIWGFLIGGAGLIMGYADTLFIGYFMTNADVGIYRVMLNFSTICLFLANAVNSTLAPKISNWYENKKISEISNTIGKSINYGLLLGIPACVGGCILCESLLWIFYGEEFISGVPTACVLFLFQIVCIVNMFISCALSNSGFIKKTFFGTVIALGINIVLNIVLIPEFGIIGAAIGSLIGTAIGCGVCMIFLRKIVHIMFDWKEFGKISISALIMGIIVWIIPLNCFILVVIGCAVYLGMLYLLKSSSLLELKNILKTFISI